MKYPKGSEWRKWDLHVHTPNSILNSQFLGRNKEEQWKNYFECLENLKDISVLGITDYYDISGYEKCLEHKLKNKLTKIDLLLPNVELRLSINTKEGKPINIHVIFDPTITNLIRVSFLEKLYFKYDNDKYYCGNNDLIRLGKKVLRTDQGDDSTFYKEGMGQFKVDFDQLTTCLSQNKFKDKYLICISNNGKDGNSGIQDDSFKATRENIYRNSHIIFSSKPNDICYFLGNGTDSKDVILEKYGHLKPCIHGSDAHSLDEVCKIENERYTWIKADPTFEGLRQILFEPEDRVKIQKDNPFLKNSKGFFSEIEVNGSIFSDPTPSFEHKSIPLNPNMVTIIGGRGTGKSLLLDVLYKTFNLTSNSTHSFSNTRLQRIKHPKLSATLTKADGQSIIFEHQENQHDYEYLHVRQGEVKEVAEDKEKLSQSIYKLLNLTDSNFFHEIDTEVSTINQEHSDILEWLNSSDDSNNKVNTIQHQDQIIRRHQNLINTITTSEIKEKIANFTINSKELSTTTDAIASAEKILTILQTSEDKINLEILSFNKNKETQFHISEINFDKNKEQIHDIIIALTNGKHLLENKNESLSLDLSKQGLTGDIPGLLDKVEAYQKIISDSESKKNKIQTNQTQLYSLRKKRTLLASRIHDNYSKISRNISEKYTQIQNGKPGTKPEHQQIIKDLLKNITISPETKFNKQKFTEGMKDFFDGRKLRKEPLEEIFNISNYDEFIQLIKGEQILKLSNKKQSLDEFVQNCDFLKTRLDTFYNYFYTRQNRDKYITILPTICYIGKQPDKLSVGQRGTFLYA